MMDSNYRTDGQGTDTGGTLVGITTEEGVIMAADTRVSRDTVVRNESVEKISQIHPTAVVGSPNDIGTVQSFVRVIRSEADQYEYDHGAPMNMSALSTVMVTELRERSLPVPTFLLGGVDAQGSHVFTIGSAEGALEATPVAIGSGKQLATGVLESEEPKSLTMTEARLTAGRAIQSAAERDVTTGIGIHLAEITDDDVIIHRYDSITDLLEDR